MSIPVIEIGQISMNVRNFPSGRDSQHYNLQYMHKILDTILLRHCDKYIVLSRWHTIVGQA